MKEFEYNDNNNLLEILVYIIFTVFKQVFVTLS